MPVLTMGNDVPMMARITVITAALVLVSTAALASSFMAASAIAAAGAASIAGLVHSSGVQACQMWSIGSLLWALPVSATDSRPVLHSAAALLTDGTTAANKVNKMAPSISNTSSTQSSSSAQRAVHTEGSLITLGKHSYVLLSRMTSVPSSFVEDTQVEKVGFSQDELDLLLADVSEEESSWSTPQLPSGAERCEGCGDAGDDRDRPLGLPEPFECELLESAHNYRLRRRMQRGSHGEVWRAVRADDASGRQLVLKRMFAGAGVLSGFRERFFGTLLRGEPRVARFLDAFEDESGDLWLVFRDEGVSLHALLYTAKPLEGEVLVRPSVFWLRLRREPAGQTVLRHLLRDMFEGLAACHARNVTHRDLKPSNLIVAVDAVDEGAIELSPTLRLADFGSAVNPETQQPGLGMYPGGPSVAEETAAYQPPESSLRGIAFDARVPASYDLWSAGIVVLETLLGTPRLLLSRRADAMLQVRLERADPEVRAKARLARTLEEYCIAPVVADEKDGQPNERTAGSGAAAVSRGAGDRAGDRAGLSLPHHCTVDAFIKRVRKMDPLAGRAPQIDAQMLDLAFRLLRWNPAERLLAAEALEHPALVDYASPASAAFASSIATSTASASAAHMPYLVGVRRLLSSAPASIELDRCMRCARPSCTSLTMSTKRRASMDAWTVMLPPPEVAVSK